MNTAELITSHLNHAQASTDIPSLSLNDTIFGVQGKLDIDHCQLILRAIDRNNTCEEIAEHYRVESLCVEAVRSSAEAIKKRYTSSKGVSRLYPREDANKSLM